MPASWSTGPRPQREWRAGRAGHASPPSGPRPQAVGRSRCGTAVLACASPCALRSRPPAESLRRRRSRTPGRGFRQGPRAVTGWSGRPGRPHGRAVNKLSWRPLTGSSAPWVPSRRGGQGDRPLSTALLTAPHCHSPPVPDHLRGGTRDRGVLGNPDDLACRSPAVPSVPPCGGEGTNVLYPRVLPTPGGLTPR